MEPQQRFVDLETAVEWTCRFEDRLGGGGTSDVYAGDFGEDGWPVAVKIIRCGDEAALLSQSEEVRMLKGLCHPNVIQCLGFAVDAQEQTIAVAFEFAHFGCLQDAVDHGGPLLSPSLEMYLIDVLQGLTYVHAQGIVHRDVKPSNILLCEGPRRLMCKLTDFGSALLPGSPRSCVGTPAFMAPEQLGGSPGPFTDVWAMGITALFLATGRLPYAPECTISSMQMMFAIAIGDLRPAILAEVSPLIRSFAEQCIAVDPAERPSVETLCGFLWKETGIAEVEDSEVWP